MTSKQKVYDALNFKNGISVPRFMWYSNKTKEQLEEKFNINGPELDIFMGNDILQTWLSINGEMERVVEENIKFTDEWGITWKRSGSHNMVIDHPLQNADIDTIKNYRLPDPLEPKRYENLEYLIENYGRDYFIGADISGTIFEPSYHLMNMEDLLIGMAYEDEKIDLLFDRIAEFSTIVSLEAVKKGADWIWLGDDLGTQSGMIMSPATWKRYLKPRMAEIISKIKKEKSDIFIAYHSCGSITEILPDLIEIGINVLNPIQPKALNMDIYEIKRKYGSAITLMGNIDTQDLMKNSTPEEVAAETRKLVDSLSENGGYIFAASHTIHPDVPLENILAMIDELNKINSGAKN